MFIPASFIFLISLLLVTRHIEPQIVSDQRIDFAWTDVEQLYTTLIQSIHRL